VIIVSSFLPPVLVHSLPDKIRTIFRNRKNSEDVLGGIEAEGRLREQIALLDLRLLNFGLMPAYTEATAWQVGKIDIRGRINERFAGFRNVLLIEPTPPRTALSFSASGAHDGL